MNQIRPRAAALSVLATLAVLAPATAARAGTYQVAICDLGVGTSYFEHAGQTNKFDFANGCTDGNAMRIADSPANSPSRGDSGRWEITSANRVPSSLQPTSVTFAATGRGDNGLKPAVLGKLRGGDWKVIAGPGALTGSFRAYGRTGAFERLKAELRCKRRGGCGQNANAYVRLKAVRFTVFEAVKPATPKLAGAIAEQPVQRDLQTMSAATSDGQSGVAGGAIEVNGQALAGLNADCDRGQGSSGNVSLGKWRPCRNTLAMTSRNTDDGDGPFREGINKIRACVNDFAGNSRCSRWRRIRVDNGCPIAPADDTLTPPVKLTSTWANGQKAINKRYPRRPRLRAALRNANGQPLVSAGVFICVTQKTALRSSSRIRALTTAMPSAGSMRPPPGASRIFYVNYWRGVENVKTTTLRLRVRPKIRMRKIRRTLHSGDTMRTRARLLGPFHSRKQLIFRVRIGGRTQTIGKGRTNKRGYARTRFRLGNVGFSAAGKVWATAAKQRRSPYTKGRSKKVRFSIAP